ncbi:MAG: pilus assembly protein TadG-related protein [Anaerolineales bacterium]|nr:pilus assembly protein TadG-related protein [Anaerolineales bacterium]
MKLKHSYERGQALILIVLAIVGMIGLVALAIDGGNVFSNRRSAQNAADSAALAGALARVKNPDLPPADLSTLVSTVARARAADNNFTTDALNRVDVNNPPIAGCSGASGPYAGNNEYIQVIIHSTVNTFFAPIVGINQLDNCVEAIARAKEGEPISLCYAALICGLSPTEKNTLRTFGGANITLVGGGAFSNSNHATQALYVADNLSLLIATINPDTGMPFNPPFGVMAVGGFNVPSDYPSPQILKAQLPYKLPLIMMPKQKYDWTASDCDYNDYHDLPQDLPASWTQADGKIYLLPGVYCVTGNFNKAAYRVGSGGTGIGGVTIVMLNQGLSWTGNTDIILNAPPDCLPKPCTSWPTAGLLVYLPYGNQGSTVKFAGTGHLEMIGTILALDINSSVQYNGTYDTGVFRSQLVGWTFEFGGDAEGTVLQPPYIYKWPGIPIVELVK